MGDSQIGTFTTCLGTQVLLGRIPEGRRWFVAAGLGAALMFLLDPRSGRRRRALIRDRTAHGVRKMARVAGKTRKRLANRARGTLAEATSSFFDETVSDDVLVERVREELGHLVAHPRQVEVHADDGHVILAGKLLETEVDPVREAVPQVRGVRTVEYRLMTVADPPSAAA